MDVTVGLVTRFGGGDRKPSEEQMRSAIREIFHEDDPSIEADYAEHPNAWLSSGFQNGNKWTVCTLDLYRDHRMIFSRFEDQDDPEPTTTRTKPHVSEVEALRLWLLLASGDCDSFLDKGWQ